MKSEFGKFFDELLFFKLTISYDGFDFSGWQIQPNERTVQYEIQNAITEIFQKQNIKLLVVLVDLRP